MGPANRIEIMFPDLQVRLERTETFLGYLLNKVKGILTEGEIGATLIIDTVGGIGTLAQHTHLVNPKDQENLR